MASIEWIIKVRMYLNGTKFTMLTLKNLDRKMIKTNTVSIDIITEQSAIAIGELNSNIVRYSKVHVANAKIR
jgi:hypothetical protein